jgi:hypothetical protein
MRSRDFAGAAADVRLFELTGARSAPSKVDPTTDASILRAIDTGNITGFIYDSN